MRKLLSRMPATAAFLLVFMLAAVGPAFAQVDLSKLGASFIEDTNARKGTLTSNMRVVTDPQKEHVVIPARGQANMPRPEAVIAAKVAEKHNSGRPVKLLSGQSGNAEVFPTADGWILEDGRVSWLKGVYRSRELLWVDQQPVAFQALYRIVGAGQEAYVLMRSIWWYRIVAAEVCGNPDRGGYLPFVVDQPLRTVTRTVIQPSLMPQPPPQNPPCPPAPGQYGGLPHRQPQQPATYRTPAIQPLNFAPIFGAGAVAGAAEYRSTTVVGTMSASFFRQNGTWKMTMYCPALDPQGIPVPPTSPPKAPVDAPSPRPAGSNTPGGIGAYQNVPISSLLGSGVPLPL